VKADRLVSILLMLQSARRRTARELAEALEVSERTIYRDVDALSAAGVPVFTERGSTGGIALAQGYRQALLHLEEDEIRAIFAGGSAILADLGLGGNLTKALDKLRGGLSDTQRRAAEKARGRIHVDQRRWNASDPPFEKLALLRRAVWDDRRVDLAYEDRAGTATNRTADPLGLVSKAGVWYVVARTADGMRSFRVDRIRDVAERAERFERPADFDLDEYWRRSSAALSSQRDSAYSVVLRVQPEAYPFVSSYWPCEHLDPGDAELVRVFFPSEGAALHHVVAWGGDVTLVEPEALRRLLVERARMMLELYDRNSA
jgi:predicted DNA-binding transcriptional regulator YafY